MSVEDRLSELEQRVRRWRRVVLATGALGVLVACVGFALGASRGQSDRVNAYQFDAEVITVKHLVVKDDEGNTVAEISGGDNGGGLILYDANGNDLVYLAASNSSGGDLLIKSRDDHLRVSLGVDANDCGRLLMFNNNQSLCAGLTTDDNGSGTIFTANRDGRPVTAMMQTETGDGEVVGFSKGRERLSLAKPCE